MMGSSYGDRLGRFKNDWPLPGGASASMLSAPQTMPAPSAMLQMPQTMGQPDQQAAPFRMPTPMSAPVNAAASQSPISGFATPPAFGQTPNPWTPPQSGRVQPAALAPYPTMQGNPFAKYLQDQQSSLDSYFSRRPY